MGICKIGEKKEIEGAFYRKSKKTMLCVGCSFLMRSCPNGTGDASSGLGELRDKSIEEGGAECRDSIWTPVTPKPAKPVLKAKWEPIPLDTKITKSGLIDIANELGAENARLKNRLAKGKAK